MSSAAYCKGANRQGRLKVNYCSRSEKQKKNYIYINKASVQSSGDLKEK